MSVFDRPTSKELLEAVIDFIDAEIKSDSYPANKKFKFQIVLNVLNIVCLLYTSPSPRDMRRSRMPSSA